MDPSKLGELRLFVEACKKVPAVLADPSLAFLRDYLQSIAAAGPAPKPPVAHVAAIALVAHWNTDLPLTSCHPPPLCQAGHPSSMLNLS